MRYPVNISRALEGLGSELEIRRPYTLERVAVGDDRYGVSDNVEVELVLRNVGKELLLKGTIRTNLLGSCGRCLEPAIIPLDIQVEELVYREPPKADEAQGEEEFPEHYFIEQEQFDLAPLIEQSIVLSVPLTPLCRPDCKGLCPICGTNWNQASCDCSQEHVDPRWDALRGLLSD